MMLLVGLFACAKPVVPTLESCASGDLAQCRALAAAAPADDPVAWQLDVWACAEGHAPSCLASARRYAAAGTVAGAAADMARACELGLAEGCAEAATLPISPAILGGVGDALARACAADVTEACARLDEAGWRSARVRGVRILVEHLDALAVLDGGTAVGVDGGELVTDGPGGALRATVSEEPAKKDRGVGIESMLVTADGRVLARAEGMVWSVLDTGATPLAAWPAPAGPVAWTSDGAMLAQPLSDATLVAWWETRGARASGVVAAPAAVRDVALSADGRRLAAATDRTVELFDTATGRVVTSVACGRRVALTPGGAVIACVADGGVRIAGADNATIATVRAAGVPTLAWRGDGSVLAIGLAGSVLLVDAAGEELARVTLPWTSPAPPRLVWSPDGGQLLVAGAKEGLVVTLADARGDPVTDTQIVRGLRKAPRAPAGGEPAVLADGVVEGTVTVGGKPARDADIRLAPCEPGGTAPSPVRTGPDGRFAFTRVPRGCWDVSASQATAIAGGDRAVLGGLSGRAKLDLALAPAGTLAGVVRARGKPVAGATVRVEGSPALTTTTGADGHFALAPVPPGPLTVRACGTDACSAPTPGDPAGKPLKLELDQPLVTVAAAAPAAPPPAPGSLKVLLPRMGEGDDVRLTPGACERTPEGCVARELAPGPYRIAVHTRDHRVGVAEITVRPGEDVVLPAPLDEPTGEIVGRVVDADSGQPLAGVVLRTACTADGGRWTFRTGPDGRFRLHGIAAGNAHAVELEGAPGFAAHRVAPDVAAGAPTDLGDVPLARAP